MRYTAKHYAEALRAAVSDIDAYREIIANIRSVAEHIATDARVRTFFADRAMPTAAQEKVISSAFRGSLDSRTSAFLRTLAGHRQFALLEQIIIRAEHIADAEDQTARVLVTSAVPLSERLRARLEKIIAAKTERRVITNYAVLPSLIGGIHIVIDQVTEWDASVAGRFERLQQRIRAAT